MGLELKCPTVTQQGSELAVRSACSCRGVQIQHRLPIGGIGEEKEPSEPLLGGIGEEKEPSEPLGQLRKLWKGCVWLMRNVIGRPVALKGAGEVIGKGLLLVPKSGTFSVKADGFTLSWKLGSDKKGRVMSGLMRVTVLTAGEEKGKGYKAYYSVDFRFGEGGLVTRIDVCELVPEGVEEGFCIFKGERMVDFNIFSKDKGWSHLPEKAREIVERVYNGSTPYIGRDP